MSLHSLDHDSVLTDQGYKGYHIDKAGEVTEFYDHRDEEPAPSSIVTARQPLVNGSSVPKSAPAKRRVRYRDAGCCDSCVNGLTWIGTMPFATAFALLLSWIGVAMFIGGGWTALDQTLDLYLRYGPLEGNPAKDPPPRYFFTGGAFSSEYVLLDSENLGNRVPQVFEALKYSFYGIIPFMLIFTIMLGCDNHRTSQALRKKQRTCKNSSAGICFTSSLMFGTYILILAWIFFLAFTTLGVYYYRITMLRCSDLTERGFTDGVFGSICIDLVQLGLIMFRNTNDAGFGKICGPGTGDTMRSFGKLKEYCDHYYPVYQCTLVCFAGCLLIIISMINFLMILTSNYNNLTRKRSRPTSDNSSSVPSVSHRSTPAPMSIPTRSVAESSISAPPPIVVPTQPRDYRHHRSSRDFELDYIIDDSTTVDRHREMDSHMGVNYYYKR